MIMNLTPRQLADELVPRFLAGEAMTVRELTEEFRMKTDDVRKGVTIARDVLGDDHNVVLPIANWHGDYTLAITTRALDAYYGEVPQLRALRTTQTNLLRRLSWTLALERERPRLGASIVENMTDGFRTLDGIIRTAELFMVDTMEGAAK